ncbi:MAG: Cys-tRNA(Pro) deacylase [Spirochaetales bacterium]|uniref:Cys-tRNA(Pro) deacylase n=1 Tax=Bullifex sp. TaxID=2815808 RepID=UPI002A54BABE|nr:Cys-tRNA(Pro) deacylase [Bullifex sp.]MDD7271734.1 Cys-tRNA(Pro) deacylase [Spirochaetales bacterium]MDY4068037.1 Cys-tRNA(Pro) deacylase [Bullifex sp.]
MKEVKTNAMRLLEQKKISYEVIEYEFDEDHLDAIHASKSAGLNPEMVYKTIVMKGSSNNLYVFVTPAEFTISLKKARALTGEKEIELLKLDQLLKYTGYIRGGCSPIGMIKQYPTYIEALAELEEYIFVSAGKRGLQLKLTPADLQKATGAEFADFT